MNDWMNELIYSRTGTPDIAASSCANGAYTPNNAIPTPVAVHDILQETNWSDAWKQLQIQRNKADDSTYWDERSKSFGLNDKPNDYALSFLQLADLRPHESVFDMGCGNGALALPAAAAEHPVLAADFSQGMLTRLQRDAAAQNITGITTKLVSWEDDWQAAGILPKSCDVAFASRSLATADMKDSLLRLSSVAKRKCCITLATSYSPRCDDRILRAIGFSSLVGRDFWYAVNILMQLGFLPEVRYIKSTRFDNYDSVQEAWENLQLMLNRVLQICPQHNADDARARLRAWFDENLREKQTGSLVGSACSNSTSEASASASRTHASHPSTKHTTYTFAQPRVVTWAFISWDV